MVELSSRSIVSVGIPGFDDLVEGGLPKGSITAITGPTGAGKSLFALQFLYNGITNNDEPGFYISFDERKKLLYKNVARVGWNFSELEADRKFVFIEYPIHEAKEFVAQESALFNMIVELGVERVVIDPITPLTLLYDTNRERRQGMMTLINKLRSWGCTTLLVVEDGKEYNIGIEPLCDGLINLHRITRKNYIIRALEIVKMRGVAHSSKLLPFKIGPKGIEIYPNQYLFEE